VKVEIAKTELSTPLHFESHALLGAGKRFAVGRTKVHHIAAVRQDKVRRKAL